jgi:hypothetical protein
MKKRLTFVFDYVFPTFILPNALDTQLGIINYISSMHTNRTLHSTIFEPPVNDRGNQIFMKDMFENSMGHNPNTAHGYFFQANVYREHLEYKESSVLFEKNPNKKFIYPIRPNPIFTQFTGVDNVIADKLNGSYFWKFISREILEKAKNNKGIIYIDYTMEPFLDLNMHKSLTESLKHSGLPAHSIIIVVNSFNAKELYESWFPQHTRKYQVRNLPFCLDHSSWFYSDGLQNNLRLSMNLDDFYNTKSTIRPNKYLMKIRNNRPHRLAVLYRLINDDLLKYGDWSYLSSNNIDEQSIKFLINQYSLDDVDVEKIKSAHTMFPHNLQSEDGNRYENINAWTDSHFKPHLDSYFEVLFETLIDGDHKSLTEKTFKPIANFQPFIFVTFAGGLKLLKELGFKTFDGFIDESYDNIESTPERLMAIHNEIKKLCAMSNEELHDWYWKMEDILIHNQKLLLDYHKVKPYGVNFINELYNIQNNIII